MKAVILAGGLGTRISEESHLKPKPMIEIGGKPIIWHILKIYSAHGIHLKISIAWVHPAGKDGKLCPRR
ncbi:MAG: sugar phosphate nucleotidyltransferase [Azovibrio sp.]|uniref:sugar phosphate nucleotidyltransferase n=1 Tax=Azovibrio sp. TaxID=1872673 RepID=UPI003C71485E